jgi:histidine phosphotransferase ChpT
MADPLELATLLCAKFSHDLSSLVASLTGILELIVETQTDIDEELSLAAQTGRELSSRLQLLRAAWAGLTEPVETSELAALAQTAIGSRKIRLDTRGLAPGGYVQPAIARVTLNVLLLAVESLPQGGLVVVSGDPEQDITIQILGHNAAWPPGLARSLSDHDYACSLIADPRTIQLPLTAMIARATGVQISMMMAANATSTPSPLLITADPNRQRSRP